VSSTIDSATSQPLTPALVGAIVGALIFIACAILLVLLWFRRVKTPEKQSSNVEVDGEVQSLNATFSTEFNFATFNGLFVTEAANDLFVQADDADPNGTVFFGNE
jgi:uncharacterized protein YabE (DUF348 family)